VKIRPATIADWSGIKKLIKSYPEKVMQDHLPWPHEFFVAIEDKKIVGCAALEIYSKRLAEVRSLVVDEGYQRNGVGTVLVEACVAKAKKKKIHEVLAITGSLPLFEKQGFKLFKEEKYALIKVLS